MTVANPRTSDVRLDAALARLRRCGLRASAARRLVLECLAAADGPGTVSDMAGRAAPPRRRVAPPHLRAAPPPPPAALGPRLGLPDPRDLRARGPGAPRPPRR